MMMKNCTIWRLAILMLGFGAISMLGCTTAKKYPLEIPQNERLVYPVKYLCGTLHPFPTVFHWTDINIINPSSTRRVRVTKKFLASGVLEIPDQREVREEPVKASQLEPRVGFFDLGPNESVAINCDDILFELGVPPTTPLEGFVEFVSDLRLTVVGIYDKCVPDKRTDVFVGSLLTGDLVIDLGGGPRTIPLRMQGPAVVSKGEIQMNREQGTLYVGTEINSMALTGTIDLGEQSIEVRLIESPTLSSTGGIIAETDASGLKPLFPARSYFDVNFEIHSADPVFQKNFGFLSGSTRVEAAIASIPPGAPMEVIPEGMDRERLLRLFPGDRIEGDQLVFDEAGDPPINVYCPRNPVPIPIFSARSPGTPVATLANHCHGPGPPVIPPHPPQHPKVSCDNASIDVEYIKPTDAKTGQVVENR